MAGPKGTRKSSAALHQPHRLGHIFAVLKAVCAGGGGTPATRAVLSAFERILTVMDYGEDRIVPTHEVSQNVATRAAQLMGPLYSRICPRMGHVP